MQNRPSRKKHRSTLSPSVAICLFSEGPVYPVICLLNVYVMKYLSQYIEKQKQCWRSNLRLKLYDLHRVTLILLIRLSYRVCSQDLQIWFSGLQQLSHHVQETLHERFDALRVTGHQQLVQSLHGNHHIPEIKKQQHLLVLCRYTEKSQRRLSQ